MECAVNLYLISQGANQDYDTYDSAVVVAESEEAARHTFPRKWGREGNWWEQDYGEWAHPEDVNVILLGTAEKDIPGVVCASFNAG